MAMDNQETTKILVIDDELSIRKFFQKRLTYWNYYVYLAENGRQAISLIQSKRPDVVITDLFMPNGDGFEVLSFLKKHAPDIPVLVVSGQGELGDAIRALRMGAWDYIYKPIEEIRFLKITIEKALDKARLISENNKYRYHLEELVTQKNAELVASEKRFRTIADFTYDWEYWIDPKGDIIYISPSCERITGYSANMFADNSALLQDIVHPDDREAFSGHVDDKNVCQIDFRILRSDGDLRWIAHCCQPVFDPEGGYMGRRCSNRDITYRKEIENNLVKQHKELISKNTRIEKANEALKAIIDQRETERRSIEQTMVTNLKRFVFPYLDDLEQKISNEDIQVYVNIIRNNIEQLISPVSRNLSGAYMLLTPTEIKVADLIRQGQPSKSIANTLNISLSTVEKHRNKIRKKLNILKKKVNLNTYLNSLS